MDLAVLNLLKYFGCLYSTAFLVTLHYEIKTINFANLSILMAVQLISVTFIPMFSTLLF